MSRPMRLERVKGTNDVLPPAAAHERSVEERLLSLFASYGYRHVAVPIVEHTDLYLRKAGEDTLARLYSFTYQNRKLSLRPELTASVVRAHIEHLQTAPLPVRLSYSGPVFRYESPQRSRYRQFTQTGLELLGAAGASADAEAMAVALHGLDALGVRQYRLVIGHVGVLLALLRSLDLDERLVAVLAAGMESLAGQGRAPLGQRLAELFPHWAAGRLPDDGDEDSMALSALVQTLGEQKARTAVLELLGAMNVGLEGNRSREEIVDRVLAKSGRARQQPHIERALSIMENLAQIKGAPDDALAAAQALLQEHGVNQALLDELRQTLTALADYPVARQRVSLDFALSRGLQYYTGLLFEIYYDGQIGEPQLCGGGRYDDLVTTLGGSRETPAIGFAYGLERVVLAMQAEGEAVAAQDAPQVLLAPVELGDHAYAVEVAGILRVGSLRVEMDVKGRGVKGNLQYANRSAAPIVVIVGERERSTRTAVVRAMATRSEQSVPLDNLAALVKRLMSEPMTLDTTNG